MEPLITYYRSRRKEALIDLALSQQRNGASLRRLLQYNGDFYETW